MARPRRVLTPTTSSSTCCPEMSGVALRRSARVVATSTALTSRTTRTIASNIASTSKRPTEGELSELSDLDSEESSPRPAKRPKATVKSASKTGNSSKQAVPRRNPAELPDVEPSDPEKKPKRRRKEPPSEPKPGDYMTRFASGWKVGPHVSAAGGVENTIANAASVG